MEVWEDVKRRFYNIGRNCLKQLRDTVKVDCWVIIASYVIPVLKVYLTWEGKVGLREAVFVLEFQV